MHATGLPKGEAESGERQPRKRGTTRQALVAIGQFIVSTVTLPVWFLRRRDKGLDSLVVYSAHPSFFLWLLVVSGFLSAAVVRNYPQSGTAVAWINIWVLVYFLMTLLYDFGTRALALWVGIFTLIWLASAYLEHLKNLVILGGVFQYLRSMKPRFDPGTATVLSWLLLLPWIGSLLHMILNGRKKFTPNEIGEFHFGEGSELTDRTGLRFRTRYRDLLETLLTFGGGDLIAVDNQQNVIKRWDNIIGLYFVWKDLDRILHQRAAVMDIGESDKERELQA